MAQLKPIKITIAAIDRVSATFRRIEGRTSGLRSTMAGVASSVAKLSAALFAIGGAAVYAGTRLVTGFIDKASGLVDAADRLGITAAKFQELSLVAEQFGITQGQLEVALKRFVKEGGNVDELFGSVADRVARISDETLRAEALVKAFGRTGQDLAPMLSRGSRALGEVGERLRAIGAFQSEDTLRRARELGDAFSRIRSGLAGLVGQGFEALLPGLERATAAIETWLMVPANRDRIVGFFRDVGESIATIADPETIKNLATILSFGARFGAWAVRGWNAVAEDHRLSVLGSDAERQRVFSENLLRQQVRARGGELVVRIESGEVKTSVVKLTPPTGIPIRVHTGPIGVGIGAP